MGVFARDLARDLDPCQAGTHDGHPTRLCSVRKCVTEPPRRGNVVNAVGVLGNARYSRQLDPTTNGVVHPVEPDTLLAAERELYDAGVQVNLLRARLDELDLPTEQLGVERRGDLLTARNLVQAQSLHKRILGVDQRDLDSSAPTPGNPQGRHGAGIATPQHDNALSLRGPHAVLLFVEGAPPMTRQPAAL